LPQRLLRPARAHQRQSRESAARPSARARARWSPVLWAPWWAAQPGPWAARASCARRAAPRGPAVVAGIVRIDGL